MKSNSRSRVYRTYVIHALTTGEGIRIYTNHAHMYSEYFWGGRVQKIIDSEFKRIHLMLL